MKLQRKFKSGAVTITVDYGYDIHSIRFSRRTYDRIKAGKPVTIKGQGFHWEGEFDQDEWCFNVDGPKAVTVTTYGGGTVFDGTLDDIWVDD